MKDLTITVKTNENEILESVKIKSIIASTHHTSAWTLRLSKLFLLKNHEMKYMTYKSITVDNSSMKQGLLVRYSSFSSQFFMQTFLHNSVTL